ARGPPPARATKTILAPTTVLRSMPDFCEKVEPEDITEQLWGALSGYAYYMKDRLGAYRWAVPGSWTMREFAAGKEKKLQTSRDMIFLNRAFDGLTQGRHHEAFEHAVRYEEYQILCLERRLRKIKRAPYRDFYLAETKKRRIRLHMEACCPRLTARYIAWKRR
ncbi:MAG: hypothetical protein Q4C13_05045, partial [Clostridia bacterium]|nr:hypothetical protein [Clostridia bacterium]